MKRGRVNAVGMGLMMSFSANTRADEGMWLFNKLPAEQLKQKYDFQPDAAWVKHVQMSCGRFGRGGSCSFVSPNGLIMTNHHVGSDAIQDVSTAEHDYMRDGFYARTREQEIKCPETIVSVLMSIEDATDKVNAGVKPDMAPAQALEARKAATAAIESEAKAKSGLHPEMVKLYGGERYHLYLYKRYTDVRLVMAPEAGIAFFGGDLENFEYPRFNLDVSFFRAYENDKPARTEHYLKWSLAGPSEGELVFMAGHPYRTQRLYTMDHLRFLRDVEAPLLLAALNQREVELMQFVAQSDEHRRIGTEDLYSAQNTRKAWTGILAGLLDGRLVQKKMEREQALRAFVEADPARKAACGSAWMELREALEKSRPYFASYYLLENRRMGMGRLYDIAKKLVRLAEERNKPDSERLPEYRETEIEGLRIDLLSTAPIYDELEQLRLSDSLTRLGRGMGGEHAIVTSALAGQSAALRAASLLAGTKLRDVEYRKKLFEGGTAAINGADDAMLRFAKDMDVHARQVRKKYEDECESVQQSVYARLAKALFEMEGDRVYPDATGTLRLSMGTVQGYEDMGRPIPPTTQIKGAYELAEKHQHQSPYDLPKRWLDRREKLDPATPFNFVSTNDIIGGNSGSPAFNQKGELVGIVFDGNIQGLVWDFQFDQEQARAVSVHSRAIIEALRKLYDADGLADELMGVVKK